MIPKHFIEQTHILGENQEGVQPLPVYIGMKEHGTPMTSVWELSYEEIAWLNKTRELWFQQYTVGNLFQPIRPTVYKDELLLGPLQVKQENSISQINCPFMGINKGLQNSEHSEQIFRLRQSLLELLKSALKSCPNSSGAASVTAGMIDIFNQFKIWANVADFEVKYSEKDHLFIIEPKTINFALLLQALNF